MTPAHAALASNVLALRTRYGWTQADLAESIGVDRARVGQWERGEVSPTLRTIELLADALGVGPADLLVVLGRA